jgi:hypothetical protein
MDRVNSLYCRVRSVALLLIAGAAFSLPGAFGIGPGSATPAGAVPARPTRIVLDAPPDRVWEALTTAGGFGTLTGFQLETGTSRPVFRSFGEKVRARVWDDRGVLTSGLVRPRRELRVTWDPTRREGLCESRFVLRPAGTGTALDVWECAAGAGEATGLRKVMLGAAQRLRAFRALVGGQPPRRSKAGHGHGHRPLRDGGRAICGSMPGVGRQR